MRFATRAFAFSFIPVGLVLAISFAALQSMVQSNVRDQLRAQMAHEQKSHTHIRSGKEVQVSRFLRFAGENASLKAGLQLLNAEPGSRDARRIVEDQLSEIGHQIGFRMLSVSDVSGRPVAWYMHGDGDSIPGSTPQIPAGKRLAEYGGQLFQLFSVPIDQGDENLGSLTVGDRFDLSDFDMPVVLLQGSRVVRSLRTQVPAAALQSVFDRCSGRDECDVRVDGTAYVSFKIDDAAVGSGYSLRSLQDIDAAAEPVQKSLRNVFLIASFGALLAAFFFGAGASRSMVRPLADMMTQLQQSEREGMLVELPADARVVEVRELISSFNRAAASIREARGNLHAAYVEFVGSLANALDARDRYTAGHSQRVSQLAASIAETIKLSAGEVEVVRVGALLHDIGKIGIPDAVLQKPGVLSDTEFVLIKQHPTIGVRILEGVNGLAPYLPSVEFHHENWDGSGYPLGLRESQIPLAARIIHIADAWDAMTSDRPYRQGFSQARALSILSMNAGKHFDPEITAVFTRMVRAKIDEDYQSILRRSNAIGENSVIPSLQPVAQEQA
jgi:putative nucleotidyltransferase with HDIG domain